VRQKVLRRFSRLFPDRSLSRADQERHLLLRKPIDRVEALAAVASLLDDTARAG
jgi:hypothetical protein